MDSSDFEAFPHVADTNHSPIDETFSYPDAFGKIDTADFYTACPDHWDASIFDSNSCCDEALPAVEEHTSEAIVPRNLTLHNTRDTDYIPLFNNSGPFGQLEQFPFGFSIDSVNEPHDTNTYPPFQLSRMPSLCDDNLEHSQSLDSSESPVLSASMQESTFDPSQNDETISKRKRGRPRLDRSQLDSSAEQSRRVPHNQVERKYREGLSAELERLRRTVPTLSQSDDGGGMSRLKPSKAIVLAGAIEYIKKVERERDAYLDEIEQLRGSSLQTVKRWR